MNRHYRPAGIKLIHFNLTLMCDFQKLAFSGDGYVVRCTECGYLQLAFGTTMLTLTNEEFGALYDLTTSHMNIVSVNGNDFLSDDTKGIFLSTPSAGCCIVLTVKELYRFHEILDKADDEMKALSMMQLFANNNS
ncbi:hypothetical protein [Parafilimonas terrae]|uniref:Uncharacterized protein n=1 Tax=Parafilimonas terrae TaxID=1465490 RepID=A0A1I5V1J5_9BACT|nr:hypothetical protein [Parafilimonas terrae]SFQ01349.1 hypothetical protein SAMN05444277_104154 [Parafilimonas terrae]